MKVVIFGTATPSVGGIGQYTQQLLPHLTRSLVAKGCEITLLLSKDSVWNSSQKGVREIRLPVVRHNRVLRVLLEHAYTPIAAWGADVFISLESRYPMVPIPARHKVLVVHDLYPLLARHQPSRYPQIHTRLKSFYWCQVIKQGVKKAERLIADSDSVVGELRTLLGVSQDRITRIYLGIDHGRFRLRHNECSKADIRRCYNLPDAFYLFVGGFVAKKNLRLVVESYAQSRVDPNAMLPVVITSSKSGHPLTSMIDSSGVSELFRFVGYAPDEDLPFMYACARALICPSLHEGFGFPPLEAMACGTPAVVSNRGSLPEVVGDAALIIDPDDPTSLGRALRKVNDESFREALIKRGLERVREFTWEETARLMAEEILAIGER